MKVLIVHPDLKETGGVSHYFNVAKKYFSNDMRYFTIGRRENENLFSKCSRVFKDYLFFAKEIFFNRYDVIHVNPSLNFKSITRDTWFVILSIVSGSKVIVFFHGWNVDFADKIKSFWLLAFKLFYDRSSGIIVLSAKFKKWLIERGFRQHIFTEFVPVDDSLLNGFDSQEHIVKRMNGTTFKILYLSRIIKDKGICETIEAFKMLSERYARMELFIAGDGEDLPKVKEYVYKAKLKNVTIAGFITGADKVRVLSESNIYCFPSYYGEGMPTSVLEAMAFGLPIVTRPVGGLADFFENGVHGFISERKDSEVFAEFIEKLYLDKDLYKKISNFNYAYAQNNFLASKVVGRLEDIYRKVYEGA